MNHALDEVREWLQKGRNDLLSAQILIEHDPPVLDTASFHCQQAVEKALKAFLAWKAVPFEKVHSLTYLLDLYARWNSQGWHPCGIGRRLWLLMPWKFAIRVRQWRSHWKRRRRHLPLRKQSGTLSLVFCPVNYIAHSRGKAQNE